MAFSRETIRNLLLYEFELKNSAETAAANINRAKGQQIVSKRTAYYWFKKFRDGKTDLNDHPRSGRPSVIDRETVIDAIDLDPTLTTRNLGNIFKCSHMEIAKILKAAGKRWHKGHWVPHLLNDAQKKSRVRIARLHLNRGQRRKFLNNIVTVDEKWISFFNPHRNNQWLSIGQRPIPTPRPDFRQRKVMLIIFWNSNGPIHWNLIEQGRTVNAEIYCEQLDLCCLALGRRYHPVILLHDNAKPHTSVRTQTKLREMGWEWLEHPPYSPDLSPTDFHLFRSLEHHLRNRSFVDTQEVLTTLTEFFKLKDAIFWKRGIDLLPEKWQKVIDFDGAYFD